jgi:hypothetical protein
MQSPTVLNVPFQYGNLSYTLWTNVNWPAQKTNTGFYNYDTLTIATNRQLWTWPLNLSCVGKGLDDGGYQHVLLSSNCVLMNCHYNPSVGERVQFTDTNGNPQVGYVSNLISLCDMTIAQMSNGYPSSVVPPSIFPANWTNKLSGKTPIGLPVFWCHKNTTTIEYAVVNQWSPSNNPPAITMGLNCSTKYPRGGNSATGGDSGSPAFMSFDGSPVLLFTVTSPTAGCMVSDPQRFSLVTNSASVRIVDLSSYPDQ